jgi:hypothetical protein
LCFSVVQSLWLLVGADQKYDETKEVIMRTRLGVILGMLVLCLSMTVVTAHATDGMTWARVNNPRCSDDCDVEHVRVGCHGCNAYDGDTDCSLKLPILCLRDTGATDPCPLLYDFYDGWVEGYLAITAPIPGTDLTSRATADAFCQMHLGAGWQMAEFHDGGGGWAYRGYEGSFIPNGVRFWVAINNQAANCWD